jgi:hypothetical protein
MSYYDDSSLFVAPNGYKTSVLFAQKPMDANGQLAFTRSNDTATRVAENGLIQKVRTNLLLQSNTFDTTWTNSNTTETSGQAGYDGTNNAWLLNATSAGGSIVQSFSVAGIQTFSVYAKAGTYGFIRVQINGTGFDKRIDVNLANGTIGTAGSGNLRASTTSIGSGWWRIQLAADTTSTALRFYPIVADNDLSGTSGNILIQAAQLETGDIATDYIPTTTTAVSVGPVANLPRIDYTGGGCGKLLLEPQRTNIALYSEQFDNASWTNVGATVTANNAISPNGYANADLITATGSAAYFRQTTSQATSSVYTLSVFAKAGTSNFVYIRNLTIIGQPEAYFNLNTGEVSFVESGLTATITNYGNGWYRLTATGTTLSSIAANLVDIGVSNTADGTRTCNVGDTSYFWGAQIELGSYATSYINTLNSAVTRGADACSKQNIAGTLPTEYPFTLYAEGFLRENNDVLLSIIDYSQSDIYYQIGATAAGFFANARNNTQSRVETSSGRSVGTHKVAAVFTSSEIRLFANGALIATGANAQVFNTNANDVLLGQLRVNSDLGQRSSVNQALVFKSALSDAEVIDLTTL